MINLYYIFSLILVNQLHQCIGFVDVKYAIYSPVGCIGCYKSMSIEYFTSLNVLYPDCATKELSNFAAVGRRDYYLFNTCENHYVTGSVYPQRFADLQAKGNAVLAAFQKCSADDKSLDDNKKANIKMYTKQFVDERTVCGDTTYLDSDIKYFQDLDSNGSTPPSIPDKNGTTSQDQTKVAPDPALPKDSTNPTPDNKPPPANPTLSDTSSKDNNPASKDANNTTQESSPPAKQTDTTSSKYTTDAAKGNNQSAIDPNITTAGSKPIPTYQGDTTLTKDTADITKGIGDLPSKYPNYTTQGYNSPIAQQGGTTETKGTTDNSKGNDQSALKDPNNTTTGPLPTFPTKTDTASSTDRNGASKDTYSSLTDPNKNTITKDSNTITSPNTISLPDKTTFTTSANDKQQNSLPSIPTPTVDSSTQYQYNSQTTDQNSQTAGLPNPGTMWNNILGYYGGTNISTSNQQNSVPTPTNTWQGDGQKMGPSNTGSPQPNLGFGQGYNLF